MKIVFWPNDSIYKIIQTIKKIPNYKQAFIDIHKDHRLFQHQRRSSYFQWIIADHNLDVIFLSRSSKTTEYRKKWGNRVQEEEKWHRFLQLLKDPRQAGQQLLNFHKVLLIKKNYVSVFVLLAEFIVLISLLYLFWSLISPKATVYITPAYDIEPLVYNFRYYPLEDKQVHEFQTYLSVPYQRKSIPYSYEASLHVQNMQYSQKEARWVIELHNTFSYTYSLKNRTTIVTDEGILFTFDDRVDVPWWSIENPWKAKVTVTAKASFENGELIWESGNIPKGKLVYIKNLPESLEEKKIRWVAASNFKWGKNIETWTVIEEDIKKIEENILSNMEKQKTAYVNAYEREDNEVLLPYPDLFEFDIQEFVTTSQIGEEASFVEGKVNTNISYPFITRENLQRWVTDYLWQRSWEDIQLTQFDRNWIIFYDYIFMEETEKTPAHYVIPTKVPIINIYNIEKDTLWIIGEIKDRIAWLDKEEAKKIILDYQEIDGAEIEISPRIFNFIPSVKARIDFKFKDL